MTPRFRMSELRVPLPNSRPEQVAAGLPAGSSFVLRGLLRLGALLAVLSTAAALSWRATGAAWPLPQVLDCLGALAWLAAAALWPAWRALKRREGWHLRPAITAASDLGKLTLLAVATVSVGLGAAGLLLAYDPRAVLVEINILDELQHALRLAPVLLVAVALLVPALLLVSLAVLHAASAVCGERGGRLVWLAAGLLVNARLICGTALPAWPLTPGAQVEWLLEQVRHSADQVYTILEAVWPLAVYPLLLLLGALLTLAAVQLMPLRPLRLDAALPLAVVGGLGSAALRTLALTGQWIGDARLPQPGAWHAVFAVGVITAVLLQAALLTGEARQRPSVAGVLGWPLLLTAGLTSMTLPQLLADQTGREEVLAHALAVYIVLLTLLAGAEAVPRFSAGRAWLGAGSLLLLGWMLLPLTLAAPPLLALLSTLRGGLLDPLSAADAWWVIASLVLTATGLWLLSRRRPLRRAAPPIRTTG